MTAAVKPERWLPIESNPDVMNSFLARLGVPQDWQINDVYGLDEELLLMLPQPVLSLMLLFPITEAYYKYAKEQEAAILSQSVSPNLFYMKQTISNACGTVALLHSVANSLGSEAGSSIQLQPGPLSTFLAAARDLNPAQRAEKLEEDDQICESHDAAARDGQTSAPAREDRVDYHFVAFVQVDGQLYELDGRKAGPVVVGPSSPDTFLSDAAAACRQYMVRDPENINFTVVALTARAD